MNKFACDKLLLNKCWI